MKKKILLILLGIIGVIFSVKDAYALENDSTVTVEYPGTIYGYHYKSGVLRSYGRVPFRYQNGVLAYCIEPYVGIHSETYSSTNDWSVTGYSEDVKKQMELISYYGYEYPGHKTLNYYLATQELIWLFNDDAVKFMDDYSEDGSLGNQINLENEKAEILNLVRRHNLTPSYSNVTRYEKYGTILNLVDENNVFKDFDVFCTAKYKVENDRIKVYLNTFGNHALRFMKRVNNNRQTTVYYYNGYSQMMASFGMNDVINSTMYLNVEGVRIRLNKRDYNTKNLIENNTATFNIKNIDTGAYVKENISTNEQGYVQFELPQGNYLIKEVGIPYGYIASDEDTIIHINSNIELLNMEYNIDIYNVSPKGKITIYKVDEEDNPLNGVEIGLYDKDHKLISTLVTSDNNVFDNLDLGTYFIKEISTLPGYSLDEEEYEISLDYVDSNTNIVNKDIKIINKLQKCNITYISSEKLNGIEINVFDEKDNIVFNGITDENGQVIINNLTYGKYYIKQVKVPSGYILNEDDYIFYVNDSTCSSNIKIHNEETIMPITSMSINKCLSLAIILMGLGIFSYVKKSN